MLKKNCFLNKNLLVLTFISAFNLMNTANAEPYEQTAQNEINRPEGFGVAHLLWNLKVGQVITIRGRLISSNNEIRDYYKFQDLEGSTFIVKLNSKFNWKQIKKDQLIDLTVKKIKQEVGFLSIEPEEVLIGISAVAVVE